MMDLFSLSLALSMGQPGIDPILAPPPPVPQNRMVPQMVQAVPEKLPSKLPVADPMPVTPKKMMELPKSNGTTTTPTPLTVTAPAPSNGHANGTANGNGNGNGANCNGCNGEEKAEEPAEEEEKGAFMKLLEGTRVGDTLDKKGVAISGWAQMSYTFSHNVDVTNLPVVWNDRANRFLLQQFWLRLEKAVDTEAKEATFGYRADILFGTDYRFTLPRGLFNSQLINTTGSQNLYGVDPIQFYVNAYLPNLFEGTDVRVGRLYTPFGYESVEGPTSPLLSRSYAFNWSPPFTHMGIQISPKFNDRWSGKFMIANGNDVFLDNSQEVRFVGAATYTSENEKDSITFGATVGRGKFNAGDPFAPQTISLMSENAGRNNINVFDIVYTHKFNDDFSYALEVIYGYQYGVPTSAVLGVIPGVVLSNSATHATAHWGSIVNYFNYNINEKLSSIVRVETFDDFDGQRTGFRGLYTAITGGLQFKPTKSILFRPEIRYDYNTESRPFEGKRSLFTASTDLIIKF